MLDSSDNVNILNMFKKKVLKLKKELYKAHI